MELSDDFILANVTEEDFKDAPLSDEGGGIVYQVIFIGDKTVCRNTETGEITVGI